MKTELRIENTEKKIEKPPRKKIALRGCNFAAENKTEKAQENEKYESDF